MIMLYQLNSVETRVDHGEDNMSKVCQICEKGKLSGSSVSFSQRRTKRSWSPNLIKTKINISGKLTSVKICAKCLKGLDK